MLWVLAALLLAGPTPESIQAQQKLKEGQHLLSSERFEQAAEAFREAIRLEPSLFMAHYGLGQSQMALKEYPAAVKAFQGAREAFKVRAADAVTRNLENDQLRQDRIRDLKDKIRENQQRVLPPDSREARERDRRVQQWEMEAAALQRSSLEGIPETPDIPPGILLALGSAHFRAGELEDAEREYRAVLALHPRQAEARNNLAVALLLTGRAAEAREQIKLAEKDGFKVAPGLKADVEKALASASAAPRQ